MRTDNPSLHFLGAAGTVTGSRFFVECDREEFARVGTGMNRRDLRSCTAGRSALLTATASGRF